jgi:hypothetical protein
MRQRHVTSTPPTIHCGNHCGGARHGSWLLKCRGLPFRPSSLNTERVSCAGHSPLLPLPLDMSSPSDSTASDVKVPEGSEGEVDAPGAAPSVSRKRGRPKGSRNKSTLEALAAKATAAASSSFAPQVARASGDAGIPEKRKPGRPKGSGNQAARREVGRSPLLRRLLLLRRPATMGDRQGAKTKRPPPSSGSTPLRRGLARRFLLR